MFISTVITKNLCTCTEVIEITKCRKLFRLEICRDLTNTKSGIENYNWLLATIVHPWGFFLSIPSGLLKPTDVPTHYSNRRLFECQVNTFGVLPLISRLQPGNDLITLFVPADVLWSNLLWSCICCRDLVKCDSGKTTGKKHDPPSLLHKV